MLEIFLLVVAGTAITRGGSPWVWGTAAIGGYFLILFFLPVALGVARDPGARWWVLFPSLAWLGMIALCARFLLGRKYARPGGMWVCPNCKMLNAHYAVICEACKQPYSEAGKQEAASN